MQTFVSRIRCLRSLEVRVAVTTLAILTHVLYITAHGQETPKSANVSSVDEAAKERTFKKHIQPLLKEYCLRCHNADNMESGVRVDRLNGAFEDKHLLLWKGILEQVTDETMPPEDEPQPTAKARRSLGEWIKQAMAEAQARNKEKNGSVRSLTVAQYRNTLKDLLGLGEDLTGVLPPDGVSKDGFANHGQTMSLSPLVAESYFDIAEKALDLCIVDEQAEPVIQNFRMDFGESINQNPCPDKLILGANSLLLKNQDFVVSELTPTKTFNYRPLAMRTAYEFIEGYQGNATVRGWRKFDSIYHAVFACLRGTTGYPKGEAYQVVPNGLLLRPAIPSSEVFGESSTYGPMANFKVSLRELPDHGNFRVTVKAVRYEDALLLDAGTPIQGADPTSSMAADFFASPRAIVMIPEEGIYQVSVCVEPGEKQEILSLAFDGRHFSGPLFHSESEVAEQTTAFMLVRLPAGPLKLAAQYVDNTRLRRIVFTRLDEGSDAANRFRVFEQRSPILGVHVGLRRDCGSTLAQVARPQNVSAGGLKEFVFEGAINDFPSPDVEQENVNYLAGVREIGVRSEYTDGRDMPRLLIRSVEFEGPYYETWPPATHRRIFIESANRNNRHAYAREVIRSFMTRAFRRTITDAEEASILAVWENSFVEKGDFRESIKDALLAVLTSPQFLFMIEISSSPEAEDLDSFELASKLSYFLWNTAPDKHLLKLAEEKTLHASLDTETQRMIQDARFEQFAHDFTSQWLSLDKFDVVNVDRKSFPRLTRDTRTELRKEPIRFLQYLIQQNLPLRNLVQSDFILANEVVASYYGLADRTESGFRFVPVRHNNENLGGVLSQASILAGLSDGRESNPVKRGAWLARKIIAEPPDDPPPNVPGLMDEDETLTLREKLQRHRNQKGCANCHAGIDPWGLPFETFDAGGLFRKEAQVDARSALPDGTEVRDLNELKDYLATDRIDRVAFSFMKHLASYAVGRGLTFHEVVFLEEAGLQLKSIDYRMQDMIRFIVQSDIFLKK